MHSSTRQKQHSAIDRIHKHDTPPFVIGIAGPSGAGKSTAVRNLTQLLDDAVAMYFDDYEASSTYPEMAQWLAEGADPNQFRTPQLSSDLRRLRSGAGITLPDEKGVVEPASVIVLEEPFGRERSEIAGLIDYVVCIDIPLEIALARKLLRMIDFFLAEQTPAALAEHLKYFLPWYLESGRDSYLAVNRRVLAHCDLVVDGTLPPHDVAQTIVSAMRQHIRHHK
jgi:uridine kinase